MKSETERLLVLSIFSIAMGMLEAAVVIYLRKLFYAEGFDFPINPIEDQLITITEILREAATIIMLISIGYFYGRNLITRFAAFLYSFAIWDIFYYVFLKLIIGWPESIYTWDILFIIPVTWVGPVIAPILVSITMILFAFVFFITDRKQKKIKLSISDWLIFIGGSFVILISFTWNPSLFILKENSFSEIINTDVLFTALQEYVPQRFNWWIFGIGELILLGGIGRFRGRQLQ